MIHYSNSYHMIFIYHCHLCECYIPKDMTSDTNRGKVFGQMQSAFMIGMFCTTMVAGNWSSWFQYISVTLWLT